MKNTMAKSDSKKQKSGDQRRPQISMAIAANEAMSAALQDKSRQLHEGILYLGGWIKDRQTIITSVFLPDAITSRGSFKVSGESMAEIVNRVCSLGLEVVGQLHTHPCDAYHSDGDVVGATLVRPGFVSIVVPDYGQKLPDLADSCVFVWDSNLGFVEMPSTSINLVPHYADCRSRV